METQTLVVQESKLTLALALLVVLNFVDLFFTIIMFEKHWIVEANRVRDGGVGGRGLSFAIAKITLCYMGVFILHRYREKPFSLYASYFTVAAYLGVLLRHAWILLILFG